MAFVNTLFHFRIDTSSSHLYFSLMYPPLSPVSPPNNNNSHESIQNILASHNSASAAMPFAIGGGLPSLTPKPHHGSSSQQQLLRSGSPGIAARKGSIERAMKIELSEFWFCTFKLFSWSFVNWIYLLQRSVMQAGGDLLCLAWKINLHLWKVQHDKQFLLKYFLLSKYITILFWTRICWLLVNMQCFSMTTILIAETKAKCTFFRLITTSTFITTTLFVNGSTKEKWMSLQFFDGTCC